MAGSNINTGVAQLVEHRSPKPSVGRSSRSSRARIRCIEIIHCIFFSTHKCTTDESEIIF